MSAAFNTANHNVKLHRLSHDVGVVQIALDCFKSYLSDIVQSIHIMFALLPVGSLGPQLFSIYAAPLSNIIQNNNFM